MPIGGMVLAPIAEEIIKSKSDRGDVTQSEFKKIEAINNYIYSGKYCNYLLSKGDLETCSAPVIRPSVPEPEPEEPMPEYKTSNYVFPLEQNPYQNWDFTGFSS